MNKLLTFIMISISMLFFLGLNMSSANAQCTVVGTDTSGAVVSIAISCDFPVFIDTGNEQSDAANYKAQKESWIASYPADYEAVSSLSDLHYELHESDLNNLSESKQTAIHSRPELYHIIQ